MTMAWLLGYLRSLPAILAGVKSTLLGGLVRLAVLLWVLICVIEVIQMIVLCMKWITPES
ncbi:hypothetical protein [Methylovorus mays]|uniref:hypothetical protein n=1 Tax=Methylovorus mays TaxID=184077 RepID=UPI001E5D841C|nr:hypothetical protein [Methylovorus mays]MCB5206614.1 hypothetical protein [Methylovorus mays]